MVTAVGPDRPGVVAALAGVLVELGCNLSDAQMAVLQGHASMMLVTDGPESLRADTLHAALAAGTDELGQAIWVRPLNSAPPTTTGPRWLVSVHGADRPGVVFEVARLLAECGINIVDLECRQHGPVSSMSMEVDVPTALNADDVAQQMDRIGEELALSCSMRPMPDRP